MRAYKTTAGAWQLNFCENGRQRTLYLGHGFTAASADRIAKIITEIVACRKRGESLSADMFDKIESIPLRIRKNMARIGLTIDNGTRTLSDLTARYMDSIRHLRPASIAASEYAVKKLADFFGGGRLVSAVKQGDALVFRSASARRLSACTVSRLIRRCRTFFQFAVDLEWINKNPFHKIGGRVDTNHDRQFYVDRRTVERVLDACETDEDRLLLALARFGGLRIPSEISLLRFRDFAGGVIRIHKDTKTGSREVPLFGKIRKILEKLQSCGSFSADDFVFPGSFTIRRFRLYAAIRRAGVPIWQKLFINLRSSCITDLDERRYSDVTMDAIFGNSAAVRNRHYIQFRRDREYGRVLSDDERLLRLFRSEEFADISDDILLQKIRQCLGENPALSETLVSDSDAARKAA